MKNFFAMLMFIAQIAASIWLVAADGWLSGLLFFVITTIFIGLILSFHDTVAALFRPRR